MLGTQATAYAEFGYLKLKDVRMAKSRPKETVVLLFGLFKDANDAFCDRNIGERAPETRLSGECGVGRTTLGLQQDRPEHTL